MSSGTPTCRWLPHGEGIGHLLMVLLLAVSVSGCGQELAVSPANTTAAPPPSTTASLAASTPSTTTAHTTTTDTVWIEAEKVAEAHGITPEYAQEILIGQARQSEGLVELERLVGPDVIVEAAFDPDIEQADEVTIYVTDREAVAVVSEGIVDAGLDPAKTTVEVFVDDGVSDEEEFLRHAPFNQYEWLASPGPILVGGWRLIESDGEPVEDPLAAGFAPSEWGVLDCDWAFGRYLTSAEQTLWVGFDIEAAECGDATGTVERLLGEVVDHNQGRFGVEFEDQTMTWVGAEGKNLVWIRHEGEDPFQPAPPSAGAAWTQTPAPEMEGVWSLLSVGSDDPAAPTTLYVGASTWDIDGLCNTLSGLYWMTPRGTAAFSGSQTLAHCGNSPTMLVEEQIDAAFEPNHSLFDVTVNEDTMKWEGITASQIVWQRANP